MLDEIIRKISSEFIAEASNSPKLLEDLAAMEKYMSESYGGRIFIELLQNADDAGSTKIKILTIGEDLIFANNGRPFNTSDVNAICRSGASEKLKQTSIGFRGIGFKSTTYLTNDIIIFSDGSYFTFSKAICADKLNVEIDKIPTIRIPFVLNEPSPSVRNVVKDLEMEGFSTVFIFSNAKVHEFIKEIENINSGYFLFLRNIQTCEISIIEEIIMFTLVKKKFGSYSEISFSDSNDKWRVHDFGIIQLAFSITEGKVTPSKEIDAIYHAFLPTDEKFIFPFKINGNFTTDPSRKHIVQNHDSKILLESAAKNLVKMISLSLETPLALYSGLFEMLIAKNSFSKINLCFWDIFKTLIMRVRWISLESGKKILINEYRQFPNWLENSEKIIIRSKSVLVRELSMKKECYELYPYLEEFLALFSPPTYDTSDFITIMQDVTFVKEIQPKLQAKIFSEIVKGSKRDKLIFSKDHNLEKINLSTNAGVKDIRALSKEHSISLDSDIKQLLGESLIPGELEWLSQKTKMTTKNLFNFEKEDNQITNIKPSLSEKVKEFSLYKWRSAEQHCVEIELNMGNNAKDVSKLNYGYDVESITPNGTKRFIEVKIIDSLGESFSITNNEYSSAHQIGEAYYICLIRQLNTSLEVLFIKDPINSLKLEKRVRQWEWICDDYGGDFLKFELK